MNETSTTPVKAPLHVRWLWRVILCLLGYLAVVTGNYLCLKNHVYDRSVGWTVFVALGVITFVLAVIVITKPKN